MFPPCSNWYVLLHFYGNWELKWNQEFKRFVQFIQWGTWTSAPNVRAILTDGFAQKQHQYASLLVAPKWCFVSLHFKEWSQILGLSHHFVCPICKKLPFSLSSHTCQVGAGWWLLYHCSHIHKLPAYQQFWCFTRQRPYVRKIQKKTNTWTKAAQ